MIEKLRLLTMLAWIPATTVWAMPSSITYQGTLIQKGVPVNTPQDLSFRLTSQNGQTPYTNTITMTQVPVVNGHFAVDLTFQLVGGYAWDSINPYMEVTVNNNLLTPREKVNTTLYAEMASSVADNAVTTSKIADGAVTAPKLDPAIVSGVIPTGTIVAFGGAVPPSGWLLCDGSLQPISAYPKLSSVLGTVWGGNGSTTFGVPDLRGRAPIGAGQGPSLSNRTLGQVAGEETHILTVGEMPSHNHGVIDPGHQHATLVGLGASGSGGNAMLAGTGNSPVPTNSAVTGISIQNAGGAGAHNNMQPYSVVNFIIKI